MSLGDLHKKSKLSLSGKLRPDRFRRSYYLPNQRVDGWSANIQCLRRCWEAGEATELETDYSEGFDQSKKPSRWPEWLTKP